MKKMIIAMCALAFAGAVHAAAVGWSLANMTNLAGDSYSFFVVGQNGVDSVAQITALCDGGKDISGYTMGSGTVNDKGMAMVAATASGKTLDAGNTYESFFVIFDAATQDAATSYVTITSANAAGLKQSPKATAGTITFAGGNVGDFVNAASNWTSISSTPTPPGPTPDVPEPTSALLLAIGGAMLALRRKQK